MWHFGTENLTGPGNTIAQKTWARPSSDAMVFGGNNDTNSTYLFNNLVSALQMPV